MGFWHLWDIVLNDLGLVIGDAVKQCFVDISGSCRQLSRTPETKRKNMRERYIKEITDKEL